MREIKFRFWDAHKKTFTQDYDGILLTPQGDTLVRDELLASNDGVVEFFTGLKDKNGVEIYEGDIVKGITGNDDGEFSGEVAFSAHRGWEILSERKIWDEMIYDHGLVWEEYEIIGNVHQNPELVK